MSSNIGYIYIRTNEHWDSYDACKLGKANNILHLWTFKMNVFINL